MQGVSPFMDVIVCNHVSHIKHANVHLLLVPSIPGFVSVSSDRQSRFGTGECRGLVPGALSAHCLARGLRLNMGGSMGGHSSHGPLLAFAWAPRGAP
eukprot:3558254-Pleurochrysis_carterae.AAC.4